MLSLKVSILRVVLVVFGYDNKFCVKKSGISVMKKSYTLIPKVLSFGTLALVTLLLMVATVVERCAAPSL